jgi:3',5'-nucleoside bisphosphate phosphatase
MNKIILLMVLTENLTLRKYKADLHIHSVLSPCGDLDMSPSRIISEAKNRRIDILGISDHNSTLHCELMVELGREEGIFVLPGVEINTREEIHCLAFFASTAIAGEFQFFLDENLPHIPNVNTLFGEQLVVDRNENIINEQQYLLVSALIADIYQTSEKVKELGGIFIPAHIDRPYNSILSQLGFVPADLQKDALEVSARFPVSVFKKQHPEYENITLITNSDAHLPEAVGRATSTFEIAELTFDEISKALNNIDGRKVITA